MSLILLRTEAICAQTACPPTVIFAIQYPNIIKSTLAAITAYINVPITIASSNRT